MSLFIDSPVELEYMGLVRIVLSLVFKKLLSVRLSLALLPQLSDRFAQNYFKREKATHFGSRYRL
jgi:hypothetical protein